MDAINLAEAKAHASPRKRIDGDMLQTLTATMPSQSQGADDLVRSMRNDDRY